MDDRDCLFSVIQGKAAEESSFIAESFDSSRLTQARLAKGFTKAKLAELIGVSAVAISQYESRTTVPRKALVVALSKVLEVPPDFFSIGRPRGSVDGTQLHFRSLKSTSARERDQARSFVEQVWELAFALEKRVNFPNVNLPDLNTDDLNPLVAAQVLRKYWNLSDKPISHLTTRVESNGVIVLLVGSLNCRVSRVDAFSTSHLTRPIIVSTKERAKSVYRHRFTVAHELGHLLLHSEVIPGDRQQEQEADQFAAEFLAPRFQMEAMLPEKLDFPTLEMLSRHWGVSIDSLLFRMKELGKVSDITVRRGFKRLNQMRKIGLIVEDPYTVYPGETPSILKQAVELAGEYGFDLNDLAHELKWLPKRVADIVGIDSPLPKLKLVDDIDISDR